MHLSYEITYGIYISTVRKYSAHNILHYLNINMNMNDIRNKRNKYRKTSRRNAHISTSVTLITVDRHLDRSIA